MAQAIGKPTWALAEQSEKPRLTREIIAEKGRMVAKRYQKVMLDLTAAALELASEKDPLALKLLAEAAETALEIGVKACADNLGADLEDK